MGWSYVKTVKKNNYEFKLIHFFNGWWFMVFNATFNNISVISWRCVLLVEETTDLSNITDKPLSHNVVLSMPRLRGIRTLVVIGNDPTTIRSRPRQLFF